MGQASGRAAPFPGGCWSAPSVEAEDPIELLLCRLFQLHDLDGNGLLEELELVQLNKKIQVLHYGRDVDTEKVRAKFQHLFRAELDPEGQPVGYATFREYIRKLFRGLKASRPEEQEMILEHWVLEALQGRLALRASTEGAGDALPLGLGPIDADASLDRWVLDPRCSPDYGPRREASTASARQPCPALFPDLLGGCAGEEPPRRRASWEIGDVAPGRRAEATEEVEVK